MAITYKSKHEVKVYSDGLHVGTIKGEANGYRYFPRGSKTGGALYGLLTHCQSSLEQQASMETRCG